MKFKDNAHRQFYDYLFNESGSKNDGFHRGLFYLLSLLPDTRRHINDLYDIKNDRIRPDGLTEPWQTGSSIRITRLAFNLYNGFTGREIEPESLYTANKLLDNPLCEYCLEACRLRYDYLPQMEHQTIFEDEDENEWGL